MRIPYYDQTKISIFVLTLIIWSFINPACCSEIWRIRYCFNRFCVMYNIILITYQGQCFIIFSVSFISFLILDVQHSSSHRPVDHVLSYIPCIMLILSSIAAFSISETMPFYPVAVFLVIAASNSILIIFGSVYFHVIITPSWFLINRHQAS